MIPHRCKNRVNGKRCLRRRALRQRIERYERPPRCRWCGSNKHWYVDEHRLKRREAFLRKPCRCDGLPHPHRVGSAVWCSEHPVGPSEADYRDRYPCS